MKLENICTNCQVLTFEDVFGLNEVVFSYGVPVFSWSGNAFHRHWSGWSATTQRHINRAFKLHLTKAQWDAMEVKELEFPNSYT